MRNVDNHNPAPSGDENMTRGSRARTMPFTVPRTLFRALILAGIFALSGCLGGEVSETDSTLLSGEWTTLGGNLMVFMETSGGGCEINWNVLNDTIEHVVDCRASAAEIMTTTTSNYTLVGDVLFMQSIHIEIEYLDGNNGSSANMSDITICGAYVPRDITDDEPGWIAEVNAVTWPSYCTEVVGIDA